MKIVVIGDGDTAVGFRLAGADAFEVSSLEEGERIFKQVVYQEDVGLIIITEELAKRLANLIEEARKKTLPVIIVIPGSTGPIDIPSLGEYIGKLFGLGHIS